MSSPENMPSVVIVPGLANNEKGSVLIPLTREALEDRDIKVMCLDGIAGSVESSQYAKTPDELFTELSTITEQSEQPPVVVTHCLGAVALVKAMKMYPEMRGVMIAPPLGSPSELMNHPNVTSKQRIEGGEVVTEAKFFDPAHPFDFSKLTSQDVTITGDYYDQLRAANEEFSTAVYDLHQSGRLSLIVPEDDWNTSAAPFVESWEGNTLFIPGAKHALNSCGDPDRIQQTANISDAVDFMVRTQFVPLSEVEHQEQMAL